MGFCQSKPEDIPPSMESLLSEATPLANDDDTASLDANSRETSAEEKGSDCVDQFVGLKKCIQTNPDAFKLDVLERSEDDT
ncbi:hypothetical protein L1987_55085 [Smallanthus sonchifolius]|uniref:Uncharacterized protein n=1 Tax=Smallanthus sonchifolius TaxID=185202 RepID=A0ACB9E8K9_9ASTR|nr:hypothetical protein L1987_55085 [Smallanthus sonchifolius]